MTRRDSWKPWSEMNDQLRRVNYQVYLSLVTEKDESLATKGGFIDTCLQEIWGFLAAEPSHEMHMQQRSTSDMVRLSLAAANHASHGENSTITSWFVA